MALNVANWSDKQLDELTDLLRSANFSAVAAFISTNYLAVGDRIMTDDINSTIKFSVGVDPKTVVVSPGVFMTGGFVSQIDTSQVINILNTTSGNWGTGLIADAGNDRWDIVCVKHADQLNTPESRWFVDDSTSPNTYSERTVNTMINKAYYDIVVVHGTPSPVPVVPAAPAGYWTICEIRVTAGSTIINPANVYDTTTGASNRTPPNWTSASRILRLEFYAVKFAVDHDPLTGFHRSGGWHIGSSIVTSSANEINRLTGVGATVTAANLTKLTDASTLAIGELHTHGSVGGNIKSLMTPGTPYPNLNQTSKEKGFLVFWFDSSANNLWILPRVKSTVTLTTLRIRYSLSGATFVSATNDAWSFNNADIATIDWGGPLSTLYTFPTNPPNSSTDQLFWGLNNTYAECVYSATTAGDAVKFTLAGATSATQITAEVVSNGGNQGFDHVMLGMALIVGGFANAGQKIVFTLEGKILEM